jgi:hypothetical protein
MASKYASLHNLTGSFINRFVLVNVICVRDGWCVVYRAAAQPQLIGEEEELS